MYVIYEWHNGSIPIAENLTLNKVMKFFLDNNYKYIKIDQGRKMVYVSNCCWFNFH